MCNLVGLLVDVLLGMCNFYREQSCFCDPRNSFIAYRLLAMTLQDLPLISVTHSEKVCTRTHQTTLDQVMSIRIVLTQHWLGIALGTGALEKSNKTVVVMIRG